MYKENKVQTYTQRNLALSYKAEFNYLICKNMKLNLKKNHYIKGSKSDSKWQTYFCHMGNLLYHTYIFFIYLWPECRLWTICEEEVDYKEGEMGKERAIGVNIVKPHNIFLWKYDFEILHFVL